MMNLFAIQDKSNCEENKFYRKNPERAEPNPKKYQSMQKWNCQKYSKENCSSQVQIDKIKQNNDLYSDLCSYVHLLINYHLFKYLTPFHIHQQLCSIPAIYPISIPNNILIHLIKIQIKKSMSFSTKQFRQALQDSQKLPQRIQKFIKDIKNQKVEVMYYILEQIYKILTEKDPPLVKVNAIYVLKMALQTCQFPLVQMTEAFLLPLIQQIAFYQSDKRTLAKTSQYFKDQGVPGSTPNIEQLSHHFVQIATNIIFLGADIKQFCYFYTDPLETLSNYKILAKKLSEKKVDHQPSNPALKNKYEDNLIIFGNTPEYENSYLNFFKAKVERFLLQGAKGRDILDFRKLLKNRDSWLTSQILGCLNQSLEDDNFQVRRLALGLLNEFFISGDIEAVMIVNQGQIVEQIVERIMEIKGSSDLGRGGQIYPQIAGQLQTKKNFYMQFLRCIDTWGRLVPTTIYLQNSQEESKVAKLLRKLKDRQFIFPKNDLHPRHAKQFQQSMKKSQQRNNFIIATLNETQAESQRPSVASHKMSRYSHKISLIKQMRQSTILTLPQIQKLVTDTQMALKELVSNERQVAKNMKSIRYFYAQFEKKFQMIEESVTQSRLQSTYMRGLRCLQKVQIINPQYEDYKVGKINYKQFIFNINQKCQQIDISKSKASDILSRMSKSKDISRSGLDLSKSMTNLRNKDKQKEREKRDQILQKSQQFLHNSNHTKTITNMSNLEQDPTNSNKIQGLNSKAKSNSNSHKKSSSKEQLRSSKNQSKYQPSVRDSKISEYEIEELKQLKKNQMRQSKNQTAQFIFHDDYEIKGNQQQYKKSSFMDEYSNTNSKKQSFMSDNNNKFKKQSGFKKGSIVDISKQSEQSSQHGSSKPSAHFNQIRSPHNRQVQHFTQSSKWSSLSQSQQQRVIDDVKSSKGMSSKGMSSKGMTSREKSLRDEKESIRSKQESIKSRQQKQSMKSQPFQSHKSKQESMKSKQQSMKSKQQKSSQKSKQKQASFKASYKQKSSFPSFPQGVFSGSKQVHISQRLQKQKSRELFSDSSFSKYDQSNEQLRQAIDKSDNPDFRMIFKQKNQEGNSKVSKHTLQSHEHYMAVLQSLAPKSIQNQRDISKSNSQLPHRSQFDTSINKTNGANPSKFKGRMILQNQDQYQKYSSHKKSSLSQRQPSSLSQNKSIISQRQSVRSQKQSIGSIDKPLSKASEYYTNKEKLSYNNSQHISHRNQYQIQPVRVGPTKQVPHPHAKQQYSHSSRQKQLKQSGTYSKKSSSEQQRLQLQASKKQNQYYNPSTISQKQNSQKYQKQSNSKLQILRQNKIRQLQQLQNRINQLKQEQHQFIVRNDCKSPTRPHMLRTALSPKFRGNQTTQSDFNNHTRNSNSSIRNAFRRQPRSPKERPNHTTISRAENQQMDFTATDLFKQAQGRLIYRRLYKKDLDQLNRAQKRKILKSKELVFRNDDLEVGMMIHKNAQDLKIVYYVTASRFLKSFLFKIDNNSKINIHAIPASLSNLEPKKQYRIYLFAQLLQFPFKMPFIHFKYHPSLLSVEQNMFELNEVNYFKTIVPFFFTKFLTTRQITPQLLDQEWNRGEIYRGEETTYSRKILPKHFYVLQYFPDLINVEKNQFEVIYGMECEYCSTKFLLKLVIKINHFFYIQGVLTRYNDRENSQRLMEFTISCITALLEKNQKIFL